VYVGLQCHASLRLSTPSSSTATPTNTSSTPNCLTVWKYYCRDNFGWREYSE
ncbi:hypothetical protein M9458_036568, partial [Cirrhinus mrigala]